jgi:hypothetical protein
MEDAKMNRQPRFRSSKSYKKHPKPLDEDIAVYILTFLFLLTLVSFSFLGIRYASFFHRAKANYLADCSLLKDPENYITLGSYSPAENQIEINPSIVENNKYYASTLIHELCHVQQDQQNRLGNCNDLKGKIKLYFNELECCFKDGMR